jgi:hypothetical protein
VWIRPTCREPGGDQTAARRIWRVTELSAQSTRAILCLEWAVRPRSPRGAGALPNRARESAHLSGRKSLAESPPPWEPSNGQRERPDALAGRHRYSQESVCPS